MIAIRSLGGAIGLAICKSSCHIWLCIRSMLTRFEDTAVFNSRIVQLPGNIAQAVVPLGFPSSSLPALITALSTGDTKALVEIPSISPEIIEAAVGALKESFVNSFRGVWITAACFTVLALIGKI